MQKRAIPPENLDIKVRIGPLLFNIDLDSTFLYSNSGLTTEKHKHPAYELHFIVKGKGIINADNTGYEAVPNSCLVIAPGIYHEQYVNASDPIQKYVIKFCYRMFRSKENYYPKEEAEKIVGILTGIRCRFFKDMSSSISLFLDMREEVIKQQIGYYTRIQSLFMQMLINLLRCISGDGMIVYDMPQKLLWERRSFLIEYFFDNYYNSCVTAHDLGKLLHVSIRQLNRILKDLYNTTFKQKLVEKRIELSKSLLRDSDLPVRVISEKVGYASETNFSQFFKKKTGLSPISYRSNMKAKLEY